MKNIELKTYKIVTFGCQMNARDSEKLAGVLEEKGYKEIDEAYKKQLILYELKDLYKE